MCQYDENEKGDIISFSNPNLNPAKYLNLKQYYVFFHIPLQTLKT